MSVSVEREHEKGDVNNAHMLRRDEATAHARLANLMDLHQLGPFVETAAVGDRFFARRANPDGSVGAFVERSRGNGPVISPQAWLDQKAIIEAGAKIGEDVMIGPFSIVRRGAEVMEGSTLDERSDIGVGATVGEGATLYYNVKLLDHAAVSSGDTKGPNEVVYTYGLSSTYPWTL